MIDFNFYQNYRQRYTVIPITTVRGPFKGSLTVWALYAYFSDSQNAAFDLLVWCM